MYGNFLEGDHRSISLKDDVFAGHATVFMLRGIFKAWKQQIAYFINNTGMPTHELTLNLRKIVRQLREVGFKVRNSTFHFTEAYTAFVT